MLSSIRISAWEGICLGIYRSCMATSAEKKSFCEVPKYAINIRSHCPKLMKFTCYTHAQNCNTEICIATIAIQLPKVDKNIVVTT